MPLKAHGLRNPKLEENEIAFSESSLLFSTSLRVSSKIKIFGRGNQKLLIYEDFFPIKWLGKFNVLA